jgi:1,4-alpha-glucan branching enzyme
MKRVVFSQIARLGRCAFVLLAGSFATQADAQWTASPGGNQAQAPGRTGWKMDYYVLEARDWDWVLQIDTFQVQGIWADLYVRYGTLPTRAEYDFVSKSFGTSTESVTIDVDTSPSVQTGYWHIGVWRPDGTTYNITYSRGPAPSAHPGLGATVYDGGATGDVGTSFGVWAPNATAVHLAGTFNNWSGVSAPMVADTSGNWSLDVRELGHGAPYQFVVTGGSGAMWKNDPRAREVTNSSGHSVVQDPEILHGEDQGFVMPDWNDLVIYELHIGTFNDLPGGAPGTFESAELFLPYLADLGVNAIELMPVCEFPADYSWGYNYSHPFSIESAYGGRAAFASFVAKAHANGLAVFLDVLYNHWGPNDMDLWRFDGWSIGPWGGIYFYNDDRAQTPWGDSRPDYGRGEVRSYIRDNVMTWLEECKLDGLRWDSTSTIRIDPSTGIDNGDGWSLMQWCNDEVDASQPWKIQIAEDMYNAPNDWITKGTGAGGAGFDVQWDALFVHPIRTAVETPSDFDRDMYAVRDAIQHTYNGDAFQRVIYTESHDEVANGRTRVPEAIWPGNASSWYSKKRSTLAAATVMTSPGIPMIFEGQEILEDGWFHDDDPVDWNKLITYTGIHALYRDLIQLRRNQGGNTAGLKGQNTNVYHVNNTAKVVAYHRWDQGGVGDDVIVVANFSVTSFSSYTIGLPRAGTWRVRFNSDWSGYDPAFQNHPSWDFTAQQGAYDGMPFNGSLSIGPYTAVIISQ